MTLMEQELLTLLSSTLVSFSGDIVAQVVCAIL